MEPKIVCRTCLDDTGPLVEVFSTIGCDFSLEVKLKTHFNLEVDDTYKFLCICYKCIDNLNEFVKMYQLVQSSQEYFPRTLQGKSLTPYADIIDDPNQIPDANDHQIHVEVEEVMPEEIPEVVVEIIPESMVVIGTKKSTSVQLRSRVKPTKLPTKSKPSKREKKETQLSLAERRSRENEIIGTAISMTCSECNALFSTFEDLIAHYRQDHEIEGSVTCCDKQFKTRLKLLDHIKLHLDPNAFVCDICHKKFSGQRFLKKHMESHVPDDERKFACEKCPKRFATRFRLSIHMNSHSEDYSFKCHLCDKTFNQKIILYSHVRYVHGSTRTHICEVCAKVFKTKEAFLTHKADHEETPQPRLTCEFCGNKYKNKDSLNYHLISHTKANETYPCNICNKEFNSKRRVSIHQKYVHATTKLKCTVCDKEFKRPIYLKEHMALHTGESLYTCKFCPREFKSNANKYAHQKAHHPTDWEEEMLRKKDN